MTDDAAKVLALAQAMQAAIPVLEHIAGYQTGHTDTPPQVGLITRDEVDALAAFLHAEFGTLDPYEEDGCVSCWQRAERILQEGWRRES